MTMGGDVQMSWTMDEKDVQRAMQNMVKENAKLRAEIAQGVNEAKAAAAQEREWQKLREKATKEATQQMSQLNAAAQRIKDSVATPFEEAKKKTAELRDHLNAGRISVDEYRLAYVKVAKELKEATRDHAAEAEAARAAAAAKADAAKKAADAEREHAAAMREADSITQKLMTKEERYTQNVAKLNQLKDKGVLSSRDHARALKAEEEALSGQGDAIGGLTGKMSQFVVGLSSAAGVIALIKSEYDALIERQGRSADANISLAAQQEALNMNLGGADAAKIFKDIRDLSARSGVKEENVTAAVNDAMAARGDLGVDQVVNAVGSVSKIRKFAPSEMAGLAAATVDTQKQTGLNTDQSLGFLLQLQSMARTKNLKFLAENFTPAVGGVMNFGADRQTAGALLASLSHGMGDTTGAMTSTSAIQLAKQLRAFAPGQDIGTSIGMLQQNPEMRAKFLANASFEAKALPAIESLLKGGNQAKDFAAFRNGLNEDPLKMLQANIASRGASPAIGIAEQDLGLGNVANQMALGDVGGAQSAVFRRRMAEIRAQMPHRGNLLNRAEGVFDDIASGGMQTAATTLRSLQSEVATLRARLAEDQANAARYAASPTFRRHVDLANSSPAIADIVIDRNAERNLKLLEEMVTLLQKQLAEQQGKAHAGVAAGRRNNQGEGAP